MALIVQNYTNSLPLIRYYKDDAREKDKMNVEQIDDRYTCPDKLLESIEIQEG